jgi:hypothetical protein
VGLVSERTNSYVVPWSRLLVEGVVIVLSILLAFAVDAAWDRSRDAAAERIVLGDLRSELTENREAIENRWLPNHLATAVATAKVLRALHGLNAEPPMPAARGEGLGEWYLDNVIVPLGEADGVRSEVTLPVSVVSGLTATHTYGPSIASLDVLIQAGALASVTDPSLRALLASLPAVLSDLTDEELFVRNLYYEDVRPRLVGAGNSMTVIEAMGDGAVGGLYVADRVGLREVTLRGSEELARALARRMDLQVNVVGSVRGVERRLAEIIDLLQ